MSRGWEILAIKTDERENRYVKNSITSMVYGYRQTALLEEDSFQGSD